MPTSRGLFQSGHSCALQGRQLLCGKVSGSGAIGVVSALAVHAHKLTISEGSVRTPNSCKFVLGM